MRTEWKLALSFSTHISIHAPASRTVCLKIGIQSLTCLQPCSIWTVTGLNGTLGLRLMFFYKIFCPLCCLQFHMVAPERKIQSPWLFVPYDLKKRLDFFWAHHAFDFTVKCGLNTKNSKVNVMEALWLFCIYLGITATCSKLTVSRPIEGAISWFTSIFIFRLLWWFIIQIDSRNDKISKLGLPSDFLSTIFTLLPW